MSNITESLTDTLSLSDGAGAGLGYSFSEGFSFSDAAGLGAGFSLFEGLSILDGEKNLLGLFNGVSDQIGISDFIVIGLNRGNTAILFDSLTLADSLQVLSPYVTAVGDTLALSDSVGILSPIFSDSFTLSDAAGLGAGFLGADSFTLSDAAGAALANSFLAVTESLNDSLGFTDSTQHSSVPAAHVGDSLNFQDSVGASLQSFGTSYLRRYLNDVI
jgi:hypothetical protein